MSLSLGEASPADDGALIELWLAAWSAAMPSIDFEARRGWIAERLVMLRAAGAAIITATDGARLVGFVTMEQDGALDQLAVAPPAQGGGCARLLLDAAKRLSPGRVTLWVNTDNARAVRFYDREGFAAAEIGVNARSGLPIQRMQWTSAAAPLQAAGEASGLPFSTM